MKRTVKISSKAQRENQQEATGEKAEQVEQMSQRDTSEKQGMFLHGRERQGCNCGEGQEEERHAQPARVSKPFSRQLPAGGLKRHGLIAPTGVEIGKKRLKKMSR